MEIENGVIIVGLTQNLTEEMVLNGKVPFVFQSLTCLVFGSGGELRGLFRQIKWISFNLISRIDLFLISLWSL